MQDIVTPVINFINNTQIPTQIQEVDVRGLFTNPYFLVPFVGLMGYLLFNKFIKSIILIGTGFGIWIFSGSSYMQGIMVEGNLQAEKVLPIVGFGVIVVGVIIYVLFIRSD